MEPPLILIACLLSLSVGAASIARYRAASAFVYAACLAISLSLFWLALNGLAQPPQTLVLPLGLPWTGAHFRIDALAASFLSIIDLGACGASLYALGYGRHEHEPARVLPFFPVFIAGMNLVVLADDSYSFLFAWELMSLASWALVMSRHGESGTIRAGYVYLLMALFGTFALLLAFGLLGGASGSFVFDSMRAHRIPPALAAVSLALVIVGAGSKAGLVPLHVWLPLAHPAAPSHVSALMSGAMTKVAIYAFIRIVFDLMGPPAWWWGLPVLILGGVTAATGVLAALMETDLKRVLANSTIENIGIIFVALGLALAFRASGVGGAAALALTAALFHAFNHMLFKSVLFFGAGAVIGTAGGANMERLGGLIHRMPLSSGAFLVASMAASALPPFNGFASEWLILQSILVSPQLPQMGLKMLIPAIGVLLALASALAAACMVRAFGTTYLGRARSQAASRAIEADRWMIAAMWIFAALCLAAGLFPGLIIDRLQPVARMLLLSHMPLQASNPFLSIVPVSASRSSYNGLLLFAFVLASSSLAAGIVHRVASRIVRRAPAWDCGYPDASPSTQYSASSLSQPIRRVFGSVVFGARDQLDMPPPGATRAARYRRSIHDPVWEAIYLPIARGVGLLTARLDRLQYLSIRRYLSLVFVTLVFLLVVLALWG